MSPEIPKTLSFPFIISTKWSNFSSSQEAWNSLPNTLSKANVCSLNSLLSPKPIYNFIDVMLGSGMDALFPNSSGGMGTEKSSQYALPILRRHEKGK